MQNWTLPSETPEHPEYSFLMMEYKFCKVQNVLDGILLCFKAKFNK